MTRTVNCLRRRGVRRPPAPRDRRPAGAGRPDRKGREILLADRRRRDAWLAQRLRRADPRRTRPPARGRPPDPEIGHHSHEPHRSAPCATTTTACTPRAVSSPTPAPGCSGSPRTGWSCCSPTTTAPPSASPPGLQFLPALLLSPYAGLVADRFPKRRLLQITQSVMAVTALLLGAARRHRRRPGLARLRPGVRLRRRLRVRRAGPAELRQRDGRPRRPEPTRSASTPPPSTPPGSSARRWPAC